MQALTFDHEGAASRCRPQGADYIGKVQCIPPKVQIVPKGLILSADLLYSAYVISYVSFYEGVNPRKGGIGRYCYG